MSPEKQQEILKQLAEVLKPPIRSYLLELDDDPVIRTQHGHAVGAKLAVWSVNITQEKGAYIVIVLHHRPPEYNEMQFVYTRGFHSSEYAERHCNDLIRIISLNAVHPPTERLHDTNLVIRHGMRHWIPRIITTLN